MTAVIITLDDLVDRHAKWESAFKLLIEKELPHTVGVITREYQGRETDWEFIKSYLDNGLTEVASHSRTHTKPPYMDYDSEINGSKQDILDNLGTDVITWISPYGRWDNPVIGRLKQYGYLVFRGGSRKSKDFRTGSLFKVSHSIEIGDGAFHSWFDVKRLNRLFDQVYKQGGVYHLLSHPEYTNWDKGSYTDKHLDYISGRDDVLYTTLGGWRRFQG